MRHALSSICAVALALTGSASAQSRTALSWVREPGAEGCIAATELGQRVEQIVGPVLASAPEGQVSIEGRIARDGAGYVAHVLVSDRSGAILGRREVRSQASDCRALDDQLAFVIAVAIDPDAALAELPGEFGQGGEPGAELLAEMEARPPAPAPFARRATASAPASGQALAPATPDDDDDADDGLGASVGVSLTGGVGVLPDPGPGAAAEVELITGHWSHRARAALWLPHTEELDGQASAELGVLQLGIATCPELWAQGDFALSLCGGAVAAELSAEPGGFMGDERERWLFGPALDARLRFRLSDPLWIGLGAGLQSLWPRHRIAYDSAGQPVAIHRVPPIMGTAELSVGLRF
jgi:hypothetical protein